jgi:hypothetical protein
MASHTVPAFIDRLRPQAMTVGAAALGLLFVAGGLVNPDRLFPAYLYAFIFWAGVPIGCLCLLLIQHLTGGRWGHMIRGLLEAGTRTLPYVAIAFLPVLFGMKHIYIWAGGGDLAALKDPALRHAIEHKHLYLNPIFFAVRTTFYFGVWCTIALFLNRWSARLDDGPNLRIERRLRSLSGGGLVLMGLTITFASIDWAMSLDPRWQSTIYGILFMVASVLSAFTIVILLVTALRKHEPMRSVITPETTHDLGKLLLAFTMLWAYVHLSQFLIVWSANLPEEIPWYMRRMAGGWGVLGAVVLALHFVLPFPMLLSRNLKRDPEMLARIAALILAGRLCDLFWVIGPAFGPAVSGLHWMDLLSVAGLGGLWLGLFAKELSRRPLVPVNDPHLEYAHSA